LKGLTESHHILTRSIFPKYKSQKWNIINLPVKAHYLAHYFLFKSISHRSCVYAFNQMRRVSKSSNKLNCRLYAAVKEKFSQLISEHNSSRVHSEQEKRRRSKTMSGTNTYRNEITGELKRYKVGQEPQGWVCFQTGRAKSKKSKEKLSNKMQGRYWQHNAETKEVRFEKTLCAGFKFGFPPWFVNHRASANTVWIHHIESQRCQRLRINEPLPDDFAFGRVFVNKGFEKVNNHGLVKVIDLVDKKFCLVSESILPNTRYIKHGTSVDSMYLYKYNNSVFTSLKDLLTYNKHLPSMKGGKSMEKTTVPKKHFNMTAERQKFCAENYGKTFAEIGLQVISLAEYQFNEKEIYVRCA